MEMTPTVGRIVHFVELGNHYAAIITKEQQENENSVELTVFKPGEELEHVKAEFDENNGNATWHWPERV